MIQSSSNVWLSFYSTILFTILRGCPKSDILHEIWEYFRAKKTQCWPYKGIVYAVKSSSSHHYAAKEGHWTVKQQWMDLIVAQYPISCAEGVPEIWYFVWNLMLVLGRNGTVWTKRGLYMLPEALNIIVVYPRNVMKQSKSNEWLSLQHNIPFLMLRGCPKCDILYDIWELILAEMICCGPQVVCICCQKLFLVSWYIWETFMTHSSSNECFWL